MSFNVDKGEPKLLQSQMDPATWQIAYIAY